MSRQLRFIGFTAFVGAMLLEGSSTFAQRPPRPLLPPPPPPIVLQTQRLPGTSPPISLPLPVGRDVQPAPLPVAQPVNKPAGACPVESEARDKIPSCR